MGTTIREKDSGTVLAQARTEADVVGFEGNLYFAPEAVNTAVLRLTERTYTCPYKGICHWVDYVGPDGRTVRDVAWVYQNVKPGSEVIEGRYGFPSGDRGGTRLED